MFTAIALRFADGSAFFAGITVALCGMGIVAISSRRLYQSIGNCAAFVGGITALFLSATPQPVPLLIIAGVSIAGFAVISSRKPNRSRGRRTTYFSTAVIPLLVLLAMELPYHIDPTIDTPSEGDLYVVGDSLSIGADEQRLHWPELLGASLGLETHNHSFGGAKVRSVLGNAERIGDDATLIILEIGGNDIFYDTDPAAFARDLEQLAAKATAHRCTVVMLELPLPPTYNRIGAAQRRMARKYNILLVPKRHLARVLGARGATIDGLHLSHRGHALLADDLASLFS